jgi:hypothetical protein
MITRSLLPIAFAFMGILVFGGCKKHQFKKHYTGTFNFTTNWRTWQPVNNNHSGTDSYSGKITFVSEGVINIHFMDQYEEVVTVGSDGNFSGSYTSGKFTDDDHLFFSVTNDQGLYGEVKDVTGTRK